VLGIQRFMGMIPLGIYLSGIPAVWIHLALENGKSGPEDRVPVLGVIFSGLFWPLVLLFAVASELLL
jgi:hypothetical protein